METIRIQPCTVAELADAPNIAALLAVYGIESAIDGLGGPNARLDLYTQMEAAGVLYPIAAFQGDDLIGFLILIISVLPHYGACVASTESFFVASAARKTGAGLKLLHEAERIAAEHDALGFFVSAPTGGRLDQVLAATHYRETNRVFFRRLS